MKTIEQPFEVVHIFDNGGKTLDRFTVQILFEDGESYLIGSGNQPIGMFTTQEGYLNSEEWLEENEDEKEIQWEELPYEVQKAVVNFIDS